MTQTYRTTSCARSGHPEITITFARELPVPNLERTLLSYFESGVAKGTKFLPGQIVQLGWAALRLKQRDDGTLGVEEMDLESESGWVESVDRSLMETWFQKEVVVSLGLEGLAFPRQTQTAVVCDRLGESPLTLLARGEPADADDSGWFLGCFDENHDHENVDNLSIAPLLHITARVPFVTQFLALPRGANVLISGPGRIRATVLIDGEERQPRPGSYLAALSSEEGR